ncbi:MAG: cob(I)alamin adenosyltransferase [Chloroflexota bacterium]|jgi:cob(I)alamin adenosyltransferase|nr:cob(I)alamin adenosyltransferase [Chloroflexota bacterium]
MTDDPGGPTRRRARIENSIVATGRGDDGTTGLLYGGRVSKDDPRTEAYGTIDEAVAALAVARAEAIELESQGRLPSSLDWLVPTILRIQRELFVVAAELATNPDARDRLQDAVTRVSEPMLLQVEDDLAAAEAGITLGNEFVVPGATRLSSLLEVARTIVRRAERRAIGLRGAGHVPGPWLVPYLNRLADYLWIVARQVESAQSGTPDHLVARLRGPAG